MSHYDSKSLRSRSGMSHARSRPDTADDDEEGGLDRFSPDSYLRSLAQRQTQRLRVRRRWRHTRRDRNKKKPALSLAERIVIAKLDPEHFSVQATKCPDLQQAVSMTPRPPLSELIRQYRRLETTEKDLGVSMMDGIKAAQDHMKRVEHHVQQPIIVEGAEQNVYMSPSPPPPPHPPDHAHPSKIVEGAEQNFDVSQSTAGKTMANLSGRRRSTEAEQVAVKLQPTNSPGSEKNSAGVQSSGNAHRNSSEGQQRLLVPDTDPRHHHHHYSHHHHHHHQRHNHHHNSSSSVHESLKTQQKDRDDSSTDGQNDRKNAVADAAKNTTTTTTTTTAVTDAPSTSTVASATTTEPSSIIRPNQNDGSKHCDTMERAEKSSYGVDTVYGRGHRLEQQQRVDSKCSCYYDDRPVVLTRADLCDRADSSALSSNDETAGRNRRRSRGAVVAEPDGSRCCCSPVTNAANVSFDSSENEKEVSAAMQTTRDEENGTRQQLPTGCVENSTRDDFERSSPENQEKLIPGVNVEATSVRDEREMSELSNHTTTSSTLNVHSSPSDTADTKHGISESADSADQDNDQDIKRDTNENNNAVKAYFGSVFDDVRSSSSIQHNCQETSNEQNQREEGEGNRSGSRSDTSPTVTFTGRRNSRTAVTQDDSQDRTRNNSDYYQQIVVRDEDDASSDRDDNPILTTTTTTITIARANNILKQPDGTGTTQRRHSDVSIRREYENNQEQTRPTSSDQASRRSQSKTGHHNHDEDERPHPERNRTNRRKSLAGFSPHRGPGRNAVSETSHPERSDSVHAEGSRSRSNSDARSLRGQRAGGGSREESSRHSSESSVEGSSQRPTPHHHRERKPSTRQAGSVSHRSELSPSPVSPGRGSPLPVANSPTTTSNNSNSRSVSMPLKPLRSDFKVRFHNNESDITVNCSDGDDGDDDEDEDAADDRIYDFIGLSRERSYTLPEVVFRRKPSIYSNGSGAPVVPRYPLHDDSGDIRPGRFSLHSAALRSKASDAGRTQFCPMHRRCSISIASNSSQQRVSVESSSDRGRHSSSSSPPPLKLPALVAPADSLSGSTTYGPVRRKSEGYVREKLPDISQSVNLVGNRRHLQETVNEDREHRVMGLYHELRHFNAYCRTPSTLRVNVSRRTSDLDMRIEWGRRLPPEESSTLRIKYHSTTARNNKNKKGGHKTTSSSSADQTSDLKLPKIEDKKYTPKKFRRNFVEKFIFLDDEEEAQLPPSVEVRRGGEGFVPDVTWFVQPGVASERCDVGFSYRGAGGGGGGNGGGGGSSLGRKNRAWVSLKNKCLPRMHIMRSLEIKSFVRRPVPRLRLDWNGAGPNGGTQTHKSP